MSKKSRKLSRTSIATAEVTAKLKARDKYLSKTYGISLADYDEMLLNQKSSCAICKKSQLHFKSSLAVDHNHKTGKIRGLLCYYCNHRLVGRHTLESARKIYRYLLRYDVETG